MIKNKTTMNYGKNIPLTDGMTTLCYNTIEYTFYIVIFTFSPIVGPLEWYKVVHVYANTSIYNEKKSVKRSFNQKTKITICDIKYYA